MSNYNVILCGRNKVPVLHPEVFAFNPPPAPWSRRISISIICTQTDVITAICDPGGGGLLEDRGSSQLVGGCGSGSRQGEGGQINSPIRPPSTLASVSCRR